MTTKIKSRTARRGNSDDTPSWAEMESFGRSGKIMMWAILVFPICLYAVVILFAPLDVFDQYPVLKKWSDWVHSLLLTSSGRLDIYGHARSTSFPQVAMLTSAFGVSIAWFVAVFMTIRGVAYFKEYAHFSAQQARDNLTERWKRVFLLPVVGVFTMWSFYCLKGDPSFAAGLTTQGRGGYLFISAIAIAFFAVGVGNALFMVRFLFYRPVRRDTHE
jgi:hypothetical protein